MRIPLEQLLWLVGLRSFKEFVQKYNESKYVTDGVRIFLVQRRTCKKYIQETLCKISRTKFSLGNFAIARAKIAATMARKVMHKTGLILGLAMVATYELSMGKASLAFPIIATRSEVDDDPRTVDFDTYFFDVLADNCANRTITPHKEDFIEFRELSSSVSGIGNARILGIGTVRWVAKADDGSELEIIDRRAMYVPDVEYRILSVAEWGKQREDKTQIITSADEEMSVIISDFGKKKVTIPHTNGLPKLRCKSPEPVTYRAYASEFQCYATVCQPTNSRMKQEQLYSLYLKKLWH